MDLIGVITVLFGIAAGAGMGFMMTAKRLDDASDYELTAILKQRRFERALKRQTNKEVEEELENETSTKRNPSLPDPNADPAGVHSSYDFKI